MAVVLPVEGVYNLYPLHVQRHYISFVEVKHSLSMLLTAIN